MTSVIQATDVGGRALAEGAGGLVPRLAEGVTLLGGYESSGLRSPRFLARRGDGQVVLLSELLYLVASYADGQRDLAEIAVKLSSVQDHQLGRDEVAYLIDKKLTPLGLIVTEDSPAVVPAPRAKPILSLAARGTLMRPQAVDVVARLFRPMFLPPLVVAVVLGWGLTNGWILATQPFSPALQRIASHPGLLLATFGLILGGSLFHEWGHATACRYGGARAGTIGVGIYLMFPTFFTNVTDSYRLNRRGRLRTDLGGVYFNAAFIVVAGALYAVTRNAVLLVVIMLTNLEMIEQMLPLVRFDGYFVLSDLVGVPDLFARIGPILGSLFRRRAAPHPRVVELSPRTRAIVRGWVLVTAPALLVSLVLLVIHLPAFFRREWAAARTDWHQVSSALHSSHWATAVLGVISLIILAVPLAGLAILTVRATKRVLPGGHAPLPTPASALHADTDDVLPGRVSSGRRQTLALKAVLERPSAPALQIGQFAKPTVPKARQRYRQAIKATDRDHNLERMIRDAPSGRCIVIAVISPKGGAGKTTITALLGMLFAEVRRDPVLALDANPDFGNLKDKLSRPGEVVTTTDELAAWLDAEAVVTPAQLSGRLGVGPHGLRFLPSPVEDLERMVKAADVDLYRQLLARLRDYEGIIVVDCGTGVVDPPVRAALETADQIVLVTDSAADTAGLVVAAANRLPATPTWLVANKMPSRGATVDLNRVAAAIPQLRGLTVIPEQRLTENIVTPEFSWKDAPAAWQGPVREIAARLANNWKAIR